MSGKLTAAELRIMRVLWKLNEGTVGDVVAAIGDPPLAYTTVLTMLKILEQKRFAKRRLDGRAHIYVPRVREAEVAKSALGDVVKSFFPNRKTELALALIAEEKPSKSEIERLKALIAGYEGKKK